MICGKNKFSMPDFLKTMLILLLVLAISFLFDTIHLPEINIYTMFVLGILLTAMVTASEFYSVISAICGVLLFNYLFAEPRFSIQAYHYGYPITFITLLAAALIVGSLAGKSRRNSRQREEATLQMKNEQLRSNLLRSISHDLRTPLTTISGDASLLCGQYGQLSEDKAKELLSDISDNAEWLLNSVENLLSVTRIEDGRMNIQMHPESVDEVISEALSHITDRSKQHTIHYRQNDELLLAKMDVRLILQVIINLVDNALKYTPKDSVIDVWSYRQDGYIYIAVADNGPGIADEEKEKLFDMFYTTSFGTADGRRGLGLGLPLCRMIIHVHGGEITVRDNVPHGTIFTFTLPKEEIGSYE